MPDTTLGAHLRLSAAELAAAGVPDPRLTAEVLAAHVLGRERSYLYAHPEAGLDTGTRARWDAAVARRAARTPLQYITGHQEFYGRDFVVTPAVLIPRPETELVVAAALELIPTDAPVRVIEAGTGSGCIGVTLALERPRAEVTATDNSPAALEVARANAARLGARVRLEECDLLDAASGLYDLVISNPPYIGEPEFAELQTEVRDHEPRTALIAGPTGMEVYERLIPQAWRCLHPGGWLVLELGYQSAAAVGNLLDPRWTGVEIRADLQALDRVARARSR